MNTYHLLLGCLLVPFLVSCTQPNQTHSTNEIIVSQDEPIAVKGGYFNTLGLHENSKTLACIEYSGEISNGLFLAFDNSASDERQQTPIIKIQKIIADPKYLQLCHGYFDTTRYSMVAIFPESFELSTQGYVFDSSQTPIITTNHKIIGIDLNHDNKSDYLTTCSSMEGEHLNVWDDSQKATRLAHVYRYIDADLIPTCDDVDIINSDYL